MCCRCVDVSLPYLDPGLVSTPGLSDLLGRLLFVLPSQYQVNIKSISSQYQVNIKSISSQYQVNIKATHIQSNSHRSPQRCEGANWYQPNWYQPNWYQPLAIAPATLMPAYSHPHPMLLLA